jgi:preprotein translocase SecF subunit
MRFFRKTNFDFIGKRRWFYLLSATVIGIGLVSLFTKGLDFGIDFLGGTELVVRFDRGVAIGEVRAAMERSGFGRAEIKSFGGPNEILIRTTEQGEGGTIGERMRAGLKAAYPDNPFTVLREDKIGPKIGAELRRDAIYAILASLAAILLYIGFRFKFIFGVGAVVALFHDVVLTLGLVSIFNGIVPGFNLEIDQNMIAALLTLVGLSVNDTVVIFDRIRENQKVHRSMGFVELINKSINDTLSRTIITSGTVFVVTLLLLIFGGEVNRGFAFALTVGISTGSYSTIAIASAVVVEWYERTKHKAKPTT